MKGFQPMSVELIKRTPPLVTVARVALSKLETSNRNLIESVTGILAFETRVRTLLSSMTVFSDSIQSVSTFPSSMIHLFG